MTLRMEAVMRQLPGVIEQYAAGLEAMDAGQAAASAALTAWAADPVSGDNAIARAMQDNPRPYALTLSENPAAVANAPAFAGALVVAADGSSIEVDRFAPVQCYVVNTGFVVLPYNVAGEVVLAAEAYVGPAATPPDEPGEPDVSGGGVNLLRDVLELESGAHMAVARAGSAPVTLLLDGTLYPWDLDSPQVDPLVRQQLGRRTGAALDALKDAPGLLAVGAYISASRAADVVTSLRQLADPAVNGPASDAQFFASLLGDGQRSAVFRACSERAQRIETGFSADQQVCFFYLRTGDDLARVEMPFWAATRPERVDLLHATLVDQCRRCNGYPRALQEAHEQAVISTGDRQAFSRLLEGEAARHGLRPGGNSKQMSKRRRTL